MNFFRIGLVAVLFLCSCGKPLSESSFYYWKTKFKLSSAENKILKDLEVKTLYVRFFDVDISKENKQPIPVGVIDNLDSIPKKITVIPVVFITNRTFIHLSREAVSLLATHVVSKIKAIKSDCSEFQFDCDWSDKTKENYFYFLKQVRAKNQKPLKLSATIRLHQVKYYNKTGIPPVDRGMIMFYNMGELSNTKDDNSIYNKKSSDKYIHYIRNYPLISDVALPIFNWYIHYSDKKISGLITKKNIPDLSDTSHFSRSGKGSTFIARSSFFENGIYYKEDDKLRNEKLTGEELIGAAMALHENLSEEKRKICFYDLDELNITTYDENIFKEILAIFN